MSEVFDIPTNIASRCLIDPTQYDTMYRQSIEQPDAFWSEQATTFLDWTKPWNQVSEVDMQQGRIAWFNGGELNVSVNCIDRHYPPELIKLQLSGRGMSLTKMRTLLTNNFMSRFVS